MIITGMRALPVRVAPGPALRYHQLMPILRNPRHERFAQGIAKGLSGKAAYVEAGFRARGNAAEVNAARLLRNAQVTSRLEELQAGHAKRTAVTVESIVGELEEARASALDQKQLAAAVAASLGKAKLLGLVIDRAQVEQVQRKPLREPGEIKQMTLEEWERRFRPKCPHRSR
ncbi:terminase small subunit [Mesorhizobium sp.]|uniref:terminase small subunit n=1 Tax=Mesorhizobium sp. TaxID=1871066 RepID=UPI002615D473|nr:terminase small subunit [Mesorhizobium sp.]